VSHKDVAGCSFYFQRGYVAEPACHTSLFLLKIDRVWDVNENKKQELVQQMSASGREGLECSQYRK